MPAHHATVEMYLQPLGLGFFLLLEDQSFHIDATII